MKTKREKGGFKEESARRFVRSLSTAAGLEEGEGATPPASSTAGPGGEGAELCFSAVSGCRGGAGRPEEKGNK